MAVHRSLGVGLCIGVCSWAVGDARVGSEPGSDAQAVLRSFPIGDKELATLGENPFFVLKPGYQLTFANRDAKSPVTLVITVLNETKTLGGIDTRIVEERESKGGDLVEVSRNYFAISQKTGDVYYFGEDVDMYKKGKVVSHEGSWQHGAKGATFGLAMPAKPVVGSRYYQEQAKGVAMDRAEIVSVTERITTPAGSFEGCVKMKETTPLEPDNKDIKIYAPGIGLVSDANAELVKHGKLEKPKEKE